MNIVYSSDENYVQHMGISIFSLLQNNTEVDEITIYILSNDISDESKKKLNDIVINQFRRNIVFIDFTLYKDLSLKGHQKNLLQNRILQKGRLSERCDVSSFDQVFCLV